MTPDLRGACVCDSRYDGCDHPDPCRAPNSETGHGPWCAECNPRRFESIRKSLHNLAEDFR